MNEHVSVQRAIRVGYAVVNGPVFLLMVGIAALAVYADPEGPAALLWVLAWFVLPWTWWSFAAPRWRIWALERTANWDDLLADAVASQILWPPGHLFEKTEISTRRIREREREIGWRG